MGDFQEIVEGLSKSNRFYQNTLARLAAMQALFMQRSSSIQLVDAQENIRDFFLENSEENEAKDLPNFELFEIISEGVYSHFDELNAHLKAGLPPNKDFHLIDDVQKLLLLCGIYELKCHPEIDKAIIINDYINLTKAFYSGQEYRLTNAFLDQFAKKLG